jgi:hypothetical protein
VKNDTFTSGGLQSADLRPGSVGGSEVADGSLTGADIQESTLGQVPSALIGGFGRDSVEGSCDPESTAFVTCASVAINVPASGGRALLVARSRPRSESGNLEAGFCRLGTSTVGAVPGSTIPIFTSANIAIFPLNGITPPLPAGLNSFGIDCSQNSGGGIQYDEAKISAVLISPN